jgi:beta-glucosidase
MFQNVSKNQRGAEVKHPRILLLATLAVLVVPSVAQDTPSNPYMNPRLSAEERAADLVNRMTLEEKASQLVNQARDVPRLKVPSYDWWSEALHGVIADGVTEFPEPIGLAATFDVRGVHDTAAAIGVEGRIKHTQHERAGHSNMFEGLDFWAPNVNIFRDPRWGRGQETYGEDPFLSGRMAVAFVTGMQGDDPRYYRAIATPKHYAVHSGPEPTRHFADVDVSKHDEEDTYLPAFRAAVVEGHAGSVMCAYNAINGEPACANQFLMQHILRGAWHFQGYVVSDCDAVRNIFNGHHYRPAQPQASAISVIRGMDNECIDFAKVNDDHDYKPYIEAVQQGFLPESSINTALIRLFTARIRLGMFDAPETVPYMNIDEKQLDSPDHRALARRMANESMVLLKNDDVLPLKSPKRIAIIGPLADQTAVLLGNYSGSTSHTVTVLEGMKREFPDAKITYLPGTQFLSNQGDLVPTSVLTTPDGRPGLKADYSLRAGVDETTTPLTSRIEPSVDINSSNLPEQAKGRRGLSVKWTGSLNPTATGDYLTGLSVDGFGRLSLDSREITTIWSKGTNLRQVHFEKGHPVKIEVQYRQTGDAKPEAKLLWAPVNNTPDPAAVEAAKNADVVIAVVGITSRLEGEEMPVDQPGFSGGDRTDLDLPRPEEDLIEAVAASGKPMVLVLINGSALSVNWAKEHANAIVESWYSGEEGGAAIAETLSGKNNPAGRLPVTFYQNVHQLPHFEDYSMKGRTYRYFEGEPLWPFGYGLSYTSFGYTNLTLPTALNAGDSLHAAVTVANTGKVAGDEVVELYLQFPDLPGAPRRALRGFQRVRLEAGANQQVEFLLNPRDLSMVTDSGDIIVAPGKYTVSIGGGQPNTGAPIVSNSFEVRGQVILPE